MDLEIQVPKSRMDADFVGKLILYLADQLQDMGAPISTIRLVKYLYLSDVEHFKKYSSTFTGINWVRYRYGPYFFELPSVLDSQSIDLEPIECYPERGYPDSFSRLNPQDINIEQLETYTERGRAVSFRCLEPQDISKLVPFSIEGILQGVLQHWGFEDLPVLLDYVYSTEPVKFAKLREILDFSLLVSPKDNSMLDRHIKVDEEKSAHLKEMLRKHLEKVSTIRITNYYDSLYFYAIRKMDSEDSSDVVLGGKVDISPTADDTEINQIE